VPYNLNLHDTYMGIAMVYNRQDKNPFSFLPTSWSNPEAVILNSY
jgi:hypothetical protein